jgi:hypothetical protein
MLCDYALRSAKNTLGLVDERYLLYEGAYGALLITNMPISPTKRLHTVLTQPRETVDYYEETPHQRRHTRSPQLRDRALLSDTASTASHTKPATARPCITKRHRINGVTHTQNPPTTLNDQGTHQMASGQRKRMSRPQASSDTSKARNEAQPQTQTQTQTKTKTETNKRSGVARGAPLLIENDTRHGTCAVYQSTGVGVDVGVASVTRYQRRDSRPRLKRPTTHPNQTEQRPAPSKRYRL